jgi:hypothetical protein
MFNQFKKIPRLDLACSTDPLRKSINYLKIGARYTVALDSSVIVWVKNDYPETLQNLVTDQSILIHRTEWARVCRLKRHTLKVDKEEKTITFNEKGKYTTIPYETEDSVGRYPLWEDILPVTLDGNNRIEPYNLPSIGVNLDYMGKVAKIFGNAYNSKLTFYGTHRVILINLAEGRDVLPISEVGAMVMPVMLRN